MSARSRLSSTIRRCNRFGSSVPGPAKLDFIFSEPHDHEPPWQPTSTNVVAVDAHFWDWTLWLTSKVAAHKTELVRAELDKLLVHVLQPMGVETAPQTLNDAVTRYVGARAQLEHAFGVEVARDLEQAVRPVVAGA